MVARPTNTGRQLDDGLLKWIRHTQDRLNKKTKIHNRQMAPGEAANHSEDDSNVFGNLA